jgi:hypothetical protein
MDQWLATLDELLVQPFGSQGDSAEHPTPHHVDLRVSQDFWDDRARDDDLEAAHATFAADRAGLAEAITRRYGPPQRKDLRPYFGWTPPNEPGESMFGHLTNWFLEVDVWQVGDRGVVLEVGQADKELPLQLILVVGDMRST